MEPAEPNRVGIIGAGRIGQAMARTALRAGHEVVIANSRGPQSLTSVVEALGDGVTAGTVDEASAARIVVLAVPWDHVAEAVQGLEWNAQIVIDATNDFDAGDLHGRTSSSSSPISSREHASLRPRTHLPPRCSPQIRKRPKVAV